MKIYSYETALEESIKYFDGDSLAATTWINKYALRDSEGNLLESNPQMMHDRIINEVLRIEGNYSNPTLTKELLEEYFYNFKYVIPGGSAMSGIGNAYKHTSLSNCFVIESPADSYGGILKSDQELIQLMKRRGGCGLDLSNLRPASATVTNDAKTSSGLVSFMERYSNSTREVAQLGRRGALMLSVSINHPDSEGFIDAKLQDGKVTGANISVKLTDDFMRAVKSKSMFVQRFPIDASDEDLYDNYDKAFAKPVLGKLYSGLKKGTYYKVVDAYKLWMKIIHNVWQKAEPGLLFEDTILRESPADYYDGYNTVSTNPCGEIPLTPYDSCRLIAINLYSFVKNPFEMNSTFDMEKLYEVAYNTQRIMDNIIDLEVEHINDIIDKIHNDPEYDEIKRTELNLWNKILEKTKGGRRTGVGITAEGDMLAALGMQYGSNESIEFCNNVHHHIATACYSSSINMASERGTFEGWQCSELSDINRSTFVDRLYNTLSDGVKSNWKHHGRRNIACLTIAPTGTVSLMTQTTSGIEPAFKCWYIRRRKTSDKAKAVFTDKTGDMFEEFKVFHPKFIEWYRRGYNEDNLMYSTEQCINILSSLPEENLEAIYKKSPYYKSTAQDIDWVQKVKLQGAVQKWIDHSISVTVNVPNETPVNIVADVYMAAYDCGCKGCTLYRDGSRDGVLITKSDNTPKMPNLNVSRPNELEAKIVRFKNGSENWIAFIGLLNDNPFEIFTGKVDDDIRYLPKSVQKGIIKRVDVGPAVNGKTPHRYDFQYEISHGYINTLPDIGGIFRAEFWNYARFISGMLRAGVPVAQVINVINSLNSDMGETINTWKRGVARALKQFIADGVQSGDKCPECGSNLIYEGGCKKCPNCGHSKCD